MTRPNAGADNLKGSRTDCQEGLGQGSGTFNSGSRKPTLVCLVFPLSRGRLSESPTHISILSHMTHVTQMPQIHTTHVHYSTCTHTHYTFPTHMLPIDTDPRYTEPHTYTPGPPHPPYAEFSRPPGVTEHSLKNEYSQCNHCI